MVSRVIKKDPATTQSHTRRAPRIQPEATALKGALASTKGKDLTFAQIRKAAAAAMKRKSMKTAKKKVNLFADLQQSLQGALAYELGKKSALRVTELPPPPKAMSPNQIRAVRQQFNVSQATFARIMNVSTNAVESWEQGVRHPREATLKLLTIAHKHPEVLLSAE